jgi:putative endonuclease
VLQVALGDLGEFERPSRPARLPVVLRQEETLRLLAAMTGTHQLMAQMLYGTGMRLMECVRLRVRVKRFAPRGFWIGFGMFYVYVLHSDSDSGLYIGFSTDLRRRMKEHREGKAFATSYRGPWRLIYYEAYLEEQDALGREQYLKSGGGRRLLKNQFRNYLAKHPLHKTAWAA